MSRPSSAGLAATEAAVMAGIGMTAADSVPVVTATTASRNVGGFQLDDVAVSETAGS